MKNSLLIEETEDTPKITLDPANGVFEMSGRSLPEDATKFYAPIHEWLEEYVKVPNPKTEFGIKLEYFNSASAKQLVEMLIKLEDIGPEHQAKVVWYYDSDDELIETRGEEIKSIVDVDFDLQVY